jgi:hypothetical protein
VICVPEYICVPNATDGPVASSRLARTSGLRVEAYLIRPSLFDRH